MSQAATNTTPADPKADTKADTYGWDTAFAIRVDDVNAAIVRAHTSPPSFDCSTHDEQGNVDVHVSGTFGDWQMTLGGSGKLVHFSTPVTSLVVQGTTRDGTHLEYTYGGGSVEIEVELEYVPHTDPPADGTGTFHNLMVKHTGADADEQVVTVLGLYDFGASTDPQHEPFTDVSDDVKDALQSWYNDNLADFEHIFATVNLNRTADRGQFAWLLPTYTSYAYIDGNTLDDSVLGILCMTKHRPAAGLDQEISPNAIPPGSRAGFLIAPERFISEMLWPSMPLVYPGVKIDDFMLRTDATGLTLAHGPVEIQALLDKDGNPHTAQLYDFELSTADATLSIDATTKVEVSPSIYACTHSVTRYTMALHKLPSGAETIYYLQDGDPSVESWSEEGEGAKIGKIIGEVAAALVVLVVGVLTDGAGLVIAAIVVGVLAGIGTKIPDIIGAANTDDSPPITLLTANAVDPLQWSDQEDFDLDQVSLNYSLQMGGTPHFAS